MTRKKAKRRAFHNLDANIVLQIDSCEGMLSREAILVFMVSNHVMVGPVNAQGSRSIRAHTPLHTTDNDHAQDDSSAEEVQ